MLTTIRLFYINWGASYTLLLKGTSIYLSDELKKSDQYPVTRPKLLTEENKKDGSLYKIFDKYTSWQQLISSAPIILWGRVKAKLPSTT